LLIAFPLHFQPLRKSFELFGFDLLIDSSWGVWLLEVHA